MSLDSHILKALETTPTAGGSMSVNDLARHFGANPFVVLAAARRLVDAGLASPVMISVHGVPTLRGLTPLPATTS